MNFFYLNKQNRFETKKQAPVMTVSEKKEKNKKNLRPVDSAGDDRLR